MNKNGINVLSLFDGMSCGQIALDRLGIPVNRYLASEIDKYAIKVAQYNYPLTEQIGSVVDVKTATLPEIDLLIGGSPCQGFSFAGKQLNFEDPRSALFFEFVRILNDTLPKYFLLENVKMKKEYQDVISSYLGCEPIEINSSLVSAQNRKRLYWTNIPMAAMPEDKGILLKDIVHENADRILEIEVPTFNVNPSGRGMNGKVYSVNKAKSDCLTTNKGEGQKIAVPSEAYVLLNGGTPIKELKKRHITNYREADDKSTALLANMYKGDQNNGQTVFLEPIKKYLVPFDKTLQLLDKEVERGKVGYFRKDSQANRVYYVHDKEVCLTGYSGGGTAKMGQYLFGCIAPDRLNKKQNGQRFNEGKKFYTLTAQDKHGILIEGYIRKLTPVECERLQISTR